MSDPHNTVNIKDSSVLGTAIALGSGAAVVQGTVTTGDISRRGASVDELRSLIRTSRDRMLGGGSKKQRAALKADITAILEELKAEEPRPEVVRTRWTAVRETLGKIAGSIDVGKITELVTTLFGR